MRKVLVPIDGSIYSKNALMKVRDLCIFEDCELCVITIVNTLRDCDHTYNQEFKADVCKKNIEYGEKVLAEAVLLLKDYSGVVKTRLICGGDVADEIIDLAEGEDFDLIAMSNRGLGSFSRTLLGSISYKIVNASKVSNIIIK